MAFIPHLQVRNLEESIRFYRDILGFHLEWQDIDDQDHESAMMSRRDASISFSNQSYSENTEFAAELTGELMMFEEEVDFMFEEIESDSEDSTGNFSIVDSLKESNGLRWFSILDCNGYRITIAAVVNNVSDRVDTFASTRPNKREFSVIG